MDSIQLLKVLAHDKTMRIVALLLNHELCVCELEEILDIKQVNISKHLNKLKQAGVVDVHKVKQRAFYYLTDMFMQEDYLVNYIRNTIIEEADYIKDYERFVQHETTKDETIYVCPSFKKERLT
ncbi:MAG: ArsR/SmtB family transcription factor [Bacillota bacterium]